MDNISTIKELLLVKLEDISSQYKYDIVYDENDDNVFGSVIKRDSDGEIIAVNVEFQFVVNEDMGNGEFLYRHKTTELFREKFDITEQESLVAILDFLQRRLLLNKRNKN